MFKISRAEQYTIYYWTGSKWTTDPEEAKPFRTSQEAHHEMKQRGITYAYNVTPL